MKITSLTKLQILGLVQRWHYRFYSRSSIRGSPTAFEREHNLSDYHGYKSNLS
jgi:hypothetical protein